MKTTNRLRLNTGVILGCDVLAVTAGTVGLVFHIKELKETKSYNVLKDGVRDFSSGFLIGSGVYDGIKTVKIFRKFNKIAKASDDTVDSTVKDATAEPAEQTAKDGD